VRHLRRFGPFGDRRPPPRVTTVGGYFIVNLDDASELASKTEPLFQALDATIQVHLVNTAEDVQKAMPAFERAAQKYGQEEV
jgi:hypothetical protein